MNKLLFQLDTDAIANTFDTVVAFDGGADHVIPKSGITPQNVGTMVDGAIFTRSPKNKKNTALFVTGSNIAAGEAVLDAIKKHVFGDFRVSLMLDSNGSNTTAAAAVALIATHGELTGKKAVILAGTGPVGQRAGVMLAKEGVEVALTSRKLDRAQSASDAMNTRFAVNLRAAVANDETTTSAALAGANIVIATGAAGTQLVSEAQWRDNSEIEILVDANATPPLGIEGVDMMDKGQERHGKRTYGAIGFGALKLEVHRACIAQLFQSNDQVFDAEEIYALAKNMTST